MSVGLRPSLDDLERLFEAELGASSAIRRERDPAGPALRLWAVVRGLDGLVTPALPLRGGAALEVANGGFAVHPYLALRSRPGGLLGPPVLHEHRFLATRPLPDELMLDLLGRLRSALGSCVDPEFFETNLRRLADATRGPGPCPERLARLLPDRLSELERRRPERPSDEVEDPEGLAFELLTALVEIEEPTRADIVAAIAAEAGRTDGAERWRLEELAASVGGLDADPPLPLDEPEPRRVR